MTADVGRALSESNYSSTQVIVPLCIVSLVHQARMIRNTRALLRWKPNVTAVSSTAKQPQLAISLSPSSPAHVRLGLDSRPCVSLVHRRFYAKIPHDKIDRAAEKELAHKKLEAHPERVSTQSTTRQVFEPSPGPVASQENVTEGLRHDVVSRARELA